MPEPRPDPPLRCDVLVVGGGLHGAAIARDLAGRGLRVVLCEQGDLGQHATSASLGLLDPSVGLGGLEGLESGLVGGLSRPRHPRHPRQIAAECHLLRRISPRP